MDFAVIDYQPVLNWLSGQGFRIILVLFSMLLVISLLGKIISHTRKTLMKRFVSLESQKRLTTLIDVLRMIARILVIVVGMMIILSELGLNMGPLLATVGVLGLGVSLGAQTLFRDLIGGFFILLEDKIRIGDVISVNGLSGTVEAVQLRVLVLRSVNGDVHVIPNGVVQEFTNMTKDYSRALWNIGVAYKEDVDRVMEVISEEGQALREDENFAESIISDLQVLGLNEMGDSAIVIRCLIDTVPGKQWIITREFNKRIKKRFDIEGIEIPFPHRTIFVSNTGNKKGISLGQADNDKKDTSDDSSS